MNEFMAKMFVSKSKLEYFNVNVFKTLDYHI